MPVQLSHMMREHSIRAHTCVGRLALHMVHNSFICIIGSVTNLSGGMIILDVTLLLCSVNAGANAEPLFGLITCASLLEGCEALLRIATSGWS